MMRLMKAFEQASEMRVTEYSLLFFLTIEMIVAGVGYYTMDTIGISPNQATVWFFIIWIVNLYIASLFIVALKPITFAVYRVVLRVIHIDMMLYIFWSTHQLVTSPYFFGFCILELVCLFIGITKNAISYAGRWIVKFNNMWQGSQNTMPIENARGPTFPIYDLDMDVKETTFNDEFTDDLFDYYTAFEDTVSPSAFSTTASLGRNSSKNLLSRTTSCSGVYLGMGHYVIALRAYTCFWRVSHGEHSSHRWFHPHIPLVRKTFIV